MTTEQYSIGYDAGYQDGFDAALAEPVKQEPVAWWNGKETAWFEHELCGWQAPDGCTIPLYTAPVDAKAIRAEALDKVVKFLSESGLITPTGRFAAAIRGLK